MPRPIHFEIHAADTARACQFYTEVFGWTITKWDGPFEYFMIVTGPAETPGINGGLMKREGDAPLDGQAVNAYVCTVDVENLDTMTTKALSLGATIAVPKMPIPGMGWLTYIKDTEGNIMGMMQTDPTAS